MTIATINFDAVIHSAIFLAFAGAGVTLVYQGYAIIGQAKNKLQAFAGFAVCIAGIFVACFGLWNAFPSNPNAGILPASTGDSSSVSTNSGGGSVRGL